MENCIFIRRYKPDLHLYVMNINIELGTHWCFCNTNQDVFGSVLALDTLRLAYPDERAFPAS